MSAHIEHLSAQNAEVGGAARPGQVNTGGDTENEVACLTIANRYDGDTFVIEGRPERLLKIARDLVAAAEQIVEVTMREPDLRRLYGITSQVGTEVGTDG